MAGFAALYPPYALPAIACENDGYKTIHDFCKDLSLCRRGHCVRHDGQWFNVYCFADAADADKFMARFGGEKFDPAQRGKGRNWMRWRHQRLGGKCGWAAAINLAYANASSAARSPSGCEICLSSST